MTIVQNKDITNIINIFNNQRYSTREKLQLFLKYKFNITTPAMQRTTTISGKLHLFIDADLDRLLNKFSKIYGLEIIEFIVMDKDGVFLADNTDASFRLWILMAYVLKTYDYKNEQFNDILKTIVKTFAMRTGTQAEFWFPDTFSLFVTKSINNLNFKFQELNNIVKQITRKHENIDIYQIIDNQTIIDRATDQVIDVIKIPTGNYIGKNLDILCYLYMNKNLPEEKRLNILKTINVCDSLVQAAFTGRILFNVEKTERLISETMNLPILINIKDCDLSIQKSIFKIYSDFIKQDATGDQVITILDIFKKNKIKNSFRILNCDGHYFNAPTFDTFLKKIATSKAYYEYLKNDNLEFLLLSENCTTSKFVKLHKDRVIAFLRENYISNGVNLL